MKRFFLMLAVALMVSAAQSKVRLPHLICDNMVLQQQTDVRLWGWAKAGREVKVTTSWNQAAVTAKCNTIDRKSVV